MSDPASAKHVIDVGVPGNWSDFAKSHEEFLERYPALMNVIAAELNRSPAPQSGTESEAADTVAFYQTVLSVEDFNEILTLCGHGYGIGGLKVLRGLYERCVTQRYISKHPDEARLYLGYYPVNMWKMLHEAQKVYKGTYTFPGRIKRTVEADYKTVPPDIRKMKSWTSKSLPRLALEAGGQLEKLYFTCFHYPTMHSHSTQVGLLSRLELRSGSPIFKTGEQQSNVDWALSGAHAVLVQVADTHNDHFALGLDEELKRCSEDYVEIWKRKPTQSPKAHKIRQS
jgi:hypothetical protein